MVKLLSRIQPEKVSYEETRAIDIEDVGYQANVYEIQLFDQDVHILIGKIKYTYMAKGVVYFPIYLVIDDQVTDCIGLFEVEADRVIELDDNGATDVDLLGEELLFSFAKQIIQKHYDTETKTDPQTTEGVRSSDQTYPVSELPSEEKKRTDNADKQDPYLGMFPLSQNVHIKQLPEETVEEANSIVQAFHNGHDQPWVQRYFQNKHYQIHEVESNGDCFFAVLRDAFQSVGYETTVTALRKLVSDNVSEAHYRYYKEIQLMMEVEMKKCDHNMAITKQTLEGDLKKKLKSKNISQIEHRKVLDECKNLENSYKMFASEKQVHIETLHSLIGENMEDGLESMAHFQKHIMKSSFWADEFTISFLEQKLKVKIIILSEKAYHDKAMHHVLECGEDKPNAWQPNFYILTTYSGDHYRLVSYTGKSFLSYEELPYHLKTMVVMKCMENNAGPFAHIRDFQWFRQSLGLDQEKETLPETVQDKAVLMFYAKSAQARPGKGSGEHMTTEQWNENHRFQILTNIVHWRRKLDNDWMDVEHPFMVYEHAYASITHYMESAKYRKQFPDFALRYSLDSDSDISKDILLCKTAPKTQNDGEPPIKVDTDFEERQEEEQYVSLMAKFSQLDEMKRLLLGTNESWLTQFRPRKPAQPAIMLMKVRSELHLQSGLERT